MWPHCFVLAQSAPEAAPVFRALGAAFASDGAIPLGRPVSAVPPDTLLARAVAFTGEVRKRAVPISRGGTLPRADGSDAPYRCILLPLGDDGATIDAFLGAANGRDCPTR